LPLTRNLSQPTIIQRIPLYQHPIIIVRFVFPPIFVCVYGTFLLLLRCRMTKRVLSQNEVFRIEKKAYEGWMLSSLTRRTA